MVEIYKRLKKCRVCNSKNLIKYLNLGKTPLANSLVELKDKNKKETEYPLEVLYCKDCSLSQLSVVVDPKILFSKYVYRSSISKTFQSHCAQMVKDVVKIIKPRRNELVVDIASNDGCLLHQFKNEGFKTLGVEPAKNIADIANAGGIETICSFWSIETADEILKKYGKAGMITATNVLAHVNDLNEFLKAVTILLNKEGLFVVEVPYLYDIFKKNEFDTIYHEHLSYLLVKPLKRLYEKHGLKIIYIEKYPIHGGSLRIYASKNKPKSNNVQYFLNFEDKNKLYNIETYKNFDKKVKKIKNDLLNLLKNIKSKNKKVVAYGASAKGSTLLNVCGINKDLISFIVDDTPEKQNKFAPGSKIPIKNASYFEKEKSHYIILLAWNFAEELIQKTKNHRERGGKYIISIPKVRVV